MKREGSLIRRSWSGVDGRVAGVGNINDADAPLRTEVEEAMELVDVCRCGPIVTKKQRSQRIILENDVDLLFSFSGPRGSRDDSVNPILSGERNESIGVSLTSIPGKEMWAIVEVEGISDTEERNLVRVMSIALLGDWCTGRTSLLAIK